MTETVSGASTRKGKATQAGRARLRMQRIHTTPGVHPYDQVTWERRDVVMTNWRDGSINFEQHGVEFPDFWSVNAANIVTTKYFRGAVGSPQREWSLKQLVDRVVGVYTRTGREHGYFATDQDAEIFDHELKYALDGDDERPDRAQGQGQAGAQGANHRADQHHARRAPVRRGRLGATGRRDDELAGRLGQLRAARRGVPRLLVGERGQHRHHQVLPRRRRLTAARVEPQAAHRPRRGHLRTRSPGSDGTS